MYVSYCTANASPRDWLSALPCDNKKILHGIEGNTQVYLTLRMEILPEAKPRAIFPSEGSNVPVYSPKDARQYFHYYYTRDLERTDF